MTRRPPGPQARCRKVLLELSRALDGELPVARCGQIERHLASCPSCAKAAAGLRTTIAACRKADARPLPSSVRSRARARIKSLLDGE